MALIYPASGIQINYLGPLKEWRILDVKNLMRKCNYQATYNGFCKMLLRLEKKQLVESFLDPFTGRKYLYLTKQGDDYLGGEDAPPVISKSTLVHDAKVVDHVLSFLGLEPFYAFELEHLIRAGRIINPTKTLCPDAIMFGEKHGEKFKMAIELELTRKTKSKFLAKAGTYLNSTYYEFVVYIFQNSGVMNSYQKYIRDKFGIESDSKIIYALNEKILTNKFNFNETLVYHNGREGSYEELFN